jgi:metal-dependent HD superfamily phosphatase/phosphodiesterase
MISYEMIKNDPEIRTYIKAADDSLLALGYTEHSFAHVTAVAENAAFILRELGYPSRVTELAKISGILHDIGNLVNRTDHSQSGAILAFRLLDKRGMSPEETAIIVSAIGNHDEGTGIPVSDVAAALIIADKSDVRRTRVRKGSDIATDIHDRVNFSVTSSTLSFNSDKSALTLALVTDTSMGSIMDYFEIFLTRMKLCRSAAARLGVKFRLNINGQEFI